MCHIDTKKTEYYKRAVYVKGQDGKVYRIQKGGVKKLVYKKEKTELTIMTATLSLFYGDHIKEQFIKYCKRNLRDERFKLAELASDPEFDDEKFKKQSAKILKSIDHFKYYLDIANNRSDVFDRLFKISRTRRDRVLSKFNKPIQFKTLNFRARSKVNIFLEENKNSKEHYSERGKHSCINAFLNLGGIAASYGYKTLYVPVKYAKKYHGDFDDYKKESNGGGSNYQYIVIFDENKKDIYFQISKDCEVDYPDFKEELILVGGDENIKHNMEQFSDGFSIDWPRKKIDQLVKIEIRIDEVNEKIKQLENTIAIKKRNAEPTNQKADFKNEVTEIKNLNNTLKQLKTQEKQLCTSIHDDVARSIASALKRYVSIYGVGNFAIVLANIDEMFPSGKHFKYVCADGTEYSQNKIFRLCHFGEVKDVFKRIGRKDDYRVPVCLVPSHFSSQICPDCGNIDSNNRTVQEVVHCTVCGAEFPADLKSSRFLTLVVYIKDIRESLLVLDSTGTYVPKAKLKKETIKKTYIKYGRAIVNGYKELYPHLENVPELA